MWELLRAFSELESVMIRAASPMGLFERYLTLWVALCILAGLALGNLMPELFQRARRPSNTPRSTSSSRC